MDSIKSGSYTFFIFLSMSSLSVLSVTAPTRSDYEHLHKYLVNKTGPVHLNPTYDRIINVKIYMGIAAIQDYEEVSSILSLTAIFWVTWTDESKQWNPEDYGNIELTAIPILETWTPVIKIQNGIDIFSIYSFDNTFDSTKTTVAVMNTGFVLATLGGRYRVFCEPDVTFYPADEHKCAIILVGLNNILNLSYHDDIILESLFPHNEWSIKNTHTMSKIMSTPKLSDLPITPSYSTLVFTITIKREYMFSLLNIIVPIVIVSFVHVFVFLLPIESGERTSFAFTLLLTLIVFMSTVTEYLPASSNISVINIFLLHQLVASVFTTFLTVISIQIYHKDPKDKNKGILFGFAACLFKSTCSRRRGATVRHMDGDKVNVITDNETCREISLCFDKMCFWLQMFCYTVSFVSYAIYILMFKKV